MKTYQDRKTIAPALPPGGFYHGETPGTLCYVPSACTLRPSLPSQQSMRSKPAHSQQSTIKLLDQDAYIQGNWHILNLRLNPNGSGGHLFPAKPLQEVTRVPKDFVTSLLAALRETPEPELSI